MADITLTSCRHYIDAACSGPPSQGFLASYEYFGKLLKFYLPDPPVSPKGLVNDAFESTSVEEVRMSILVQRRRFPSHGVCPKLSPFDSATPPENL